VNVPKVPLPPSGFVPAVDVVGSVILLIPKPAEYANDCPSGCVELM
jgi:hypothetical protein